jgi:hypothetical protein
MGFPNVDHKELHPIAIFGVQILEAHGLAYKGFSSEAAEYQRNRFIPAEV